MQEKTRITKLKVINDKGEECFIFVNVDSIDALIHVFDSNNVKLSFIVDPAKEQHIEEKVKKFHNLMNEIDALTDIEKEKVFKNISIRYEHAKFNAINIVK